MGSTASSESPSRSTLLALVVVLALSGEPLRAQIPIQVQIRPVDAFNYICLPCVGPYTATPAAVAAFLAEVRRLEIRPTGPLMVIYWNSPLEVAPAALRWEIAYPVAEATQGAGSLVVKRFAYPRLASTVHRGAYGSTYTTINALLEWLAARGLKTFGGPTVELYLDRDPGQVPDAEKRTLVAIPVRSNGSPLTDPY